MITLRFNTCRKYTAAGQRITATIGDDGTVLFVDHDRGIDGELMSRINVGPNGELPADNEILAMWIMRRYDANQYRDMPRVFRASSVFNPAGATFELTEIRAS